MGLLKTAIVSGLAIYAVKHLSTAAERRSTPSPSSQYQDHRYERDLQYDSLPHPRSQPGPRISSYYEDYDQSSSPPRRRQPAYANASAVALDQQYEPQYAYPAETQAARQYPSPPMYRQEEVAYPSQRGFVEPEEKCDPASMSGGRPRDAEYQQAPSSLQSRSGSGEGQKLGKKEIVQDLLAGILRK
ncbi:hypothetical protein LTR91_007094 [Friedmanniomyces endolithicus]|nr:hypothetical protein LTS09_007484 [Friedmanniomyces endolithicus]KAK0282215.1 hypothetical protein LTS00_012330 [Friedmanniomyces endolithicus]KAK0828976.1 hypothetical protein LTR73_004609 [Friedmanniomyces endolithicus]KAK0996121.1 hypothetical protein LTR91_007094 [Friedmanniomyces endolithicus]KAK1012968.1 hypothetical protein LTS01_000780 [Friedmanniomyces endolithicus]